MSSVNLEHVAALIGTVVSALASSPGLWDEAISALVQNRTVATSCHDCADKNQQWCELSSY